MVSQIYILGAGGHAKVLIDLIRAAGCEPAACFSAESSSLDGVQVLVGDDAAQMRRQSDDARFIVGVGDMALRKRLARMIDTDGRISAALIHPSAIVSPSAIIEAGACVLPGAIINAGAYVGRHAVVNTGAIVEHDVRLCEGAFVGPGAVIAGAAEIGPGALVGARAVLKPGVGVGADALVGAGAVVVDDVASASCVAGVPAKRLKAA